MPRKVKTAFDASPEDRALTGIHDIAFIARERDGQRGVEVRVGGGTSIMPRVAPTLYDFVGLDDGEYLEVAEAVFRVFDRQDWLRVNRARARIKVMVDKIGIDEFRKLIDEERQGDWVNERDFDVAGLRLDVDEEDRAPDVPATYASPNGDGSDFERFRASNVTAQRQEGFSAVQVHVPRGDLTPTQLRALADIARKYSGGWVRTTVHQNVLLRWVRDETVYEVWEALRELGLGDPGADQVGDVVSCPGTDSCKLGITSSMGLNAALRERLDAMGISDPLTRKLHIKMSGCPNGCSQHHIANIGNYEGGEIVYGQRLKVRLPAKRVPEAVERWVRFYEREREDGEEFNPFAARVGTGAFEDEVRDLAMPVEFGLDTMDQFMDWGKKAPFIVQRGEGECAV
jgi:sulfite reductase beta subunit-like hemoprotein